MFDKPTITGTTLFCQLFKEKFTSAAVTYEAISHLVPPAKGMQHSFFALNCEWPYAHIDLFLLLS